MTYQGTLVKMKSQWQHPIDYTLPVGESDLSLNALIGSPLSLTFTGSIYCIQCGRKTSKSFHQGHCYPCFRRLAECNFCTIHPEKCLCEKQHCPDDDWAHSQCNQPHIVYIANTSGLKVGITRVDQIPTRWIDQGATQALPVLKVSNRYQSGLVEHALKAYLADKTNWRQMLKSDNTTLDLRSERDRLLERAHQVIADSEGQFASGAVEYLDETPYELDYPVRAFPQTVKSFNFDKQAQVYGTLMGIKGQYLIFNSGVINIRKFAGYEISVTLAE